MKTGLLALILLLTGCASEDALAGRAATVKHQTASNQDARFKAWVVKFKKEAVASGINQQVVDDAFDGVKLQSKILKLDRKQPEKTIKFPEYRDRIVSEKRIARGISEWNDHAQILGAISYHYGVPTEYLIALWGIETSYGDIKGDYPLVEALATLAFDGRRHDFFHDELMNALKIVDSGMMPLSALKGSWAGAMGNCQFMPSSYLKYAEDYDNDGKRDIWNDYGDSFASIANYLHSSGWDGSVSWGMAVELPTGFNRHLIGREIKKTAAQWKALGITMADGSPLPDDNSHGYSIVHPDGAENSYMVSRNYDVIMGWNRSLYFATSVGMLADAIRNGR